MANLSQNPTASQSHIPISFVPPSELPPILPVRDVLLQAIDSVDASRLRLLIKSLCYTNSFLIQGLSSQLLIPEKRVVRYHADTESEDAGYSDEDSDEATEQAKKQEENTLPIKLGADEFAIRYTKCQNCKEEFDLGANERGDCDWHTGKKERDEKHEVWWDWEEWQMGGTPEDFRDDPEFAEGYVWSCCQKRASEEGCKVTKHKADVNRVVVDGPESLTRESKKRKVDAVSQ